MRQNPVGKRGKYGFVSDAQQTVVTEGSGLVVVYDYRAGRKTAMPGELRKRIDELEKRGQV